MSLEENKRFTREKDFSGNERSDSMIEKVEAFAEENEEERRPAFYKSPRLRQFWGEEQEDIESWKEIFFDLIFVAVAFQVGKTLEELIQDGAGWLAGIYFFAQFLPLFSHWFMRMIYLGRYNPSSYFHGLVDICYACLIALMALFIGKRSEIYDTIGGVESEKEGFSLLMFAAEDKKSIGFNTAAAYSATSLLATLINIFRCCELIFVVRRYGIRDDISDKMKARQKKAILTSGSWDLFRTCTYFLLVSLSLVGAVIGNEALFIIPLFFAFFTVLVFIFFFILVRDCLGYPRQETVPINVNFVLQRLGEFTMLMLGEGVLQIIITDVDSEDLVGHFRTFVLSLLLLCCIYTLAFFGLPYEAHESAFRKSSLSAIMLCLLKPFQYSALIGVGVSLKLILKYQSSLEDKFEEREALAVFLLFAVVCLLLDRMLNHGYWEIVRRNSSREGRLDKSWENFNWNRVFFSIGWCLSPLLFIGIIFYETDGAQFLTLTILIFCLISLIGVVEHKLFLVEDDEEEEHEIGVNEEIREKHEKIKQSGTSVASTLRSGKRGGCNLLNMLSFVRKKTRIFEANAKKSCQDQKISWEWREDITQLRKLIHLIEDSMISFENTLAENKQR